MQRSRGRLVVGWGVLVLAMGALGWSAPAWAAGAGGAGSPLLGKPAPPFVLPTIAGEPLVESDTLYDLSSLTMLTFWTTHCAECVRRLETCQELHDWGAPDGFKVIGINFDDQPSAKIRLLARQATPGITHLYDTGGRVSEAFGAGAHSFSVYLVDPEGIVRDVAYDISVDSLAALRPHLLRLIDEAFGEFEDDEDEGAGGAADEPGLSGGGTEVRPELLAELTRLKASKLAVHGRGRVRWMHIDTTGTGATGAYGEVLTPGAFLHHRLELEMSYAVTPQLTAGGLLWLSNEGEGVLRSGPDYLSSPWGSAFIRYDAAGNPLGLGRCESSLRAGYYRVVFTPLTLMRWDQNDTPISGGQRAAGCGVCGGEAGIAGFIRLESLETLAPDLRFEGARWDLSLMDRLDLTALYARPHTPWPTGSDRSLCCTPELEAEDTYYRQEMYAGRATAHITVPWATDLLELSATAVAVEEDEEDPPCIAACMSADPFSDHVLAGDISVPLPHRTQLYGEIAGTWWQPDKSDEDADRLDGNALRTGITFDIRPGGEAELLGLPLAGMMTRLDLSYQRLSEDFYSTYNALSYEANLQGPRAFMRTDWGPIGIGAFVKRLTPVVTPEEEEGEDWRKLTASAWIDGIVWKGGTLMVGGVLDDRDLPNAVAGKEKQEILIVSFVQELAPRSSLVFELQALDGSREETEEEYTSTTIRTMLDVEF